MWKTAAAPEIQVAATQTVGGTVPATMSLTLGAPASFGAFLPGVARDYDASTTATVISSAGDATLSVVRPRRDGPGHLVNGALALTQPLQARAKDGAFAPVGGSADPTTLLTYTGRCSPTSRRSTSSRRSRPASRCARARTRRR